MKRDLGFVENFLTSDQNQVSARIGKTDLNFKSEILLVMENSFFRFSDSESGAVIRLEFQSVFQFRKAT